jgi:hypothetical protein
VSPGSVFKALMHTEPSLALAPGFSRVSERAEDRLAVSTAFPYGLPKPLKRLVCGRPGLTWLKPGANERDGLETNLKAHLSFCGVVRLVTSSPTRA